MEKWKILEAIASYNEAAAAASRLDEKYGSDKIYYIVQADGSGYAVVKYKKQ